MRPQNFRKGLLSIALCGAVCSVFWAIQQGRASSTAPNVHATEPMLMPLVAKICQAEKALQSSAAELAVLRGKLRQQRPTRTSQAQAKELIQFPRDLIAADPDLQNLYLAVEQSSLGRRYAAFYRKAQLTSAQIEKLEELVLHRNETLVDLDDIVRSNRLDPTDPAVTKLRDKTTNSFRTGFETLLGQQIYQTFTVYERTLPAWEMVDRLAGALALEGSPLNEGQADQLATAIAGSSPPFQAGGDADPDQVNWPAVIAQTAPILTPTQKFMLTNCAPRYRVVPGGTSP
jgi:hypothetical protein